MDKTCRPPSAVGGLIRRQRVGTAMAGSTHCAVHIKSMEIGMKFFTAVAAAALLLGMAACANDVVAPEQPKLEVSGPASLHKGTTAQFEAILVGGRGTQAAPVIQWSSTDTTIASVDSTGLLRGRSPGTVQISATAGSLSHSVTVSVQDDRTPPSITSLSFTPSTVRLAGGDVVMTFTVRAVDTESGVGTARVLLSQPGSPAGSHPLHRCIADSPVSGTAQDGVWQCTISLNRHLPSGNWSASAILTDRAGNLSTPHPWTEFSVAGSLPDAVAPGLQSFSLSPDSVSVRAQDARLGIHVSAADAGSGISAVRISHRFSTGGSGMISLALPSSGSVQEGIWSWTPLIPQGTSTRTLSITELQISDFRGNVISLTPEQLRARGFTTEVKITG